jgi:glycosyltransferase involved in cell wall biosynthesis
LHLLSSTGFHGAENMAAELIRGLSARGVENYVGTLRSREDSNTEIVDAVRDVVRDAAVFQCQGRADWRVLFALRRYVQEHEINVVHSHKYKTDFYAAIACRGLRCVLISTCHNWLLTSTKMKFYAALDKMVLKAFDKAVGVSSAVADELRRHLGDGKTAKIDNGVDTARFTGAISRHEAKAALGLLGKPTVGFVGRLTPDKGVASLLRAVRLLRNNGTPVEALIVGEGEHRDALQREARELGIDGSVRFLGQRRDTPALYAAMDVFVLPSRTEAFPMVVLEAMAMGVVVVASRAGDIPYILGKDGVLVDPEAVAALSAAIQGLLLDEGVAREKASAGQQRVREHFSALAMARRYHELYAEAWERRFGAH